MIFNLIGEIVTGWLLADLLSGIFHWWQDRWPSPQNWLVGSYLIKPSREHHEHPGAFLDYSFAYRNGATFVGVLSVATVLWLTCGLSLFLVILTLGGLASTQVHYLAHSPSRTNRFGKFLQTTKIIQSPKHHAEHHSYPHIRRYCALTDFVNPFLDEICVWDRLEALFVRLNIKMSLGGID